MQQNQVVANRLAHLADSICGKCPMSETCDNIPACHDIRLLKESEEFLVNE